MNRKSFLKLISFGAAVGFIKPTSSLDVSTTNTETRVTIYGCDWKYESYDFYRNGNYKCRLYPNKINRKEYIYFPPKQRGGYVYIYEKGIKTIASSQLSQKPSNILEYKGVDIICMNLNEAK